MASSKKRELIFVFLFVVAAAVIRFYNIERQSLWNDEMFSLDVATRPLASIQERLITHYHHPPLFFYFAHASLKLFGQTAGALRFTPAFFGALTVGLVYLFARKLFNPWAGIVSGLLCLVEPFHLVYSQEGRPYALAAFLCLASFYTLYLLLSERKRFWIALYLITSVALLYTHHWGVFVLGAQMIYVLILARKTSSEKQLCAVLWIIMGLMYLPEFFALSRQVAQSSPDSWFWVERPNIGEIYHLFTAFSGTYFNMASSIFSLPMPLQITGVVITVGIFLTAIIIVIKDKQQNAFQYTLFGFSGTLLIPFVISFFKPEVFLWYRYTVIVFPMFCVLIGGVIASEALRSWRMIRWIAVSSLVIVGIVGTVHYFSWQKGNAKDVALYTEQITRENDVKMIIRPKAFAPLFNYYYKGDAVQYDEVYLDQPLGGIIDTTTSFMYISLDIPNEIRSYIDIHFVKIVERNFPGEAHMGMTAGVYKQKPEEEIFGEH